MTTGTAGVLARLRRPSTLRVVFAVVALVFAIVPLLRIEATPLSVQPAPDAPVYADMAVQIANGNGFRTRVDDSHPLDPFAETAIYPSRYPPGFSLALAPFVVAGNNEMADTQAGARAAATLLVLALFLTAWLLGGPIAAGLAAIVSAISPFAEESARVVMSDAFSAALALLVVAGVAIASSSRVSERWQRVVLVATGAIAGYGVVVRFSAIAVLVSLLVVFAIARRWSLVGLIAVGAVPFLIFVGSYQWTEFGSPLRTGYDYWLPDTKLFGPEYAFEEDPFTESAYIFSDELEGALMEWTCPCPVPQIEAMGHAPNIVFYPAVLLGLYWVFFPPLVSLLGVWEIVRRRRERVGQLAALVVLSNLVLAIFFFAQGARQVAPAAYVLLAFSAVAAARLLGAAWSAVSARRSDRATTADAPTRVGSSTA